MQAQKTAVSIETPATTLSPVAEKLIEAVAAEIKGDVIARHKLNNTSPSFPYNHRTMANKDSKKQGPAEFLIVGGRCFYTKKSLLNFLRVDLERQAKLKSR
jgi:hypothetical protein